MAFLLKILNGPHGGAEVALDTGTHLVGSDASCDFVLNDAGIKAQHCRIEVRDGSLSMMPLEGTVWNGERRFESGETVSVATGTLYRLGTTIVSFLREGEPWEDPELPPLLAEETPTEHRPKSLGEDISEGVGVGEPPKTGGRNGPWRKGAMFMTIAIPVVAALCLATFHLGRSKLALQEDAASSRAGATPDIQSLRNLLTAEGYASLRLDAGPEGVFVVAGVVPSEARRSHLRKLLAAWGHPVRLQAVTAQEVRDVVTTLLAGTTAFGGETRLDEEGVVHVSGYLPNNRDLEQLRHLLRRDLPVDDLPIQWHIRTIEEAEEDLRKLLAEQHLDGLQTKRTDRAVFVSGVVPPVHEDAYRSLVERFTALYGPGILKEVQVEVAPILPPSFQIEAIMLGSRRFVVTTSGRRIKEGEEVGDGYVIESIKKDKIVLRRGQEPRQTIAVQPSIVMQHTW
ncbi:hypothetical protein TDMWS_20390 [Thermodesulfomicrobium sp. WS]|uniref:type III secretion system inner membrane ring subunit SctD n=1 Tax=Thermodesulfomicrobium sp. WS TaxID=3004129 RepID=UPI002492D1B2|nr:type III secretion system inner membrane ring subunit SctD [Thermodesulfomicrobium sp. WS]BDV01954.1 hypothetical protein TDMWS_20390 [Thermodesulfomicrobium sp. WS]